MNEIDKLLDLKNSVIIDEFYYRNIIIDSIKLRIRNDKLIKIIQRCINYIEDDERELSVDCYYKFKDLAEFDDLLEILEEYEKK